jgi:CRP-like cAMP-binding protein
MKVFGQGAADKGYGNILCLPPLIIKYNRKIACFSIHLKMNNLIATIPIDQGVDVRLENFNKGSYIYHEGDSTGHVYIVIKGRVKLTKAFDGTNREFIHHIIYPQEFMGIGEFFSRMKTRRMSAIAIDREVVVQKISHFKFEMELRKNDKLVSNLIRQLIERQENTWKRFCRRKQSSSKDIVIEALIEMAIERGREEQNGFVIQGLTHRDLGEYVGICRQNTTMVLNMLREENKIEYSREEILIKVKPLNHETMLQRSI